MVSRIQERGAGVGVAFPLSRGGAGWASLAVRGEGMVLFLPEFVAGVSVEGFSLLLPGRRLGPGDRSVFNSLPRFLACAECLCPIGTLTWDEFCLGGLPPLGGG